MLSTLFFLTRNSNEKEHKQESVMLYSEYCFFYNSVVNIYMYG